MRSLVITGVTLSIPLLLACGPNPTTGTGGTGGTDPGNPYCAIHAITEARCVSCHNRASVPRLAPMPLETYADTQVNGVNTPSQKVWQLMKTRAGQQGSMPPTGALAQGDRDVFNNWNGSGAECGGAVGPNNAPCNGNTSPAEACDPGCIGEACLSQYCQINYRFQAHAAGSNAPYSVGYVTDDYRCFTFKNPFFGTSTVVTAETPLVPTGDGVIHHWLLFGSMQQGGDGSVSGTGCVQPELRDKLISGWARGGTAYVMARDIGLQLNQFPTLILQAHYNNQGLTTNDSSGVAFCTGPARTYGATIVTLGTDNLAIGGYANNAMGGQSDCGANLGGTASGLAKVAGQSVYVIGSSPHMHKLGSSFFTKQTGSTTRMISDVAKFSFDKQFKYLHPRFEVRPNDLLHTICNYTNPTGAFVAFGIGTTSEMCYDFLMAYPAAAVRGECGQGITFANQ